MHEEEKESGGGSTRTDEVQEESFSVKRKRQEGRATKKLKHGYCRNREMTVEYRAWVRMRQRCTNSKLNRWQHYGGKGISVCERWRLFENFLADMGLRPTSEHSLDRINGDGNYEPSNCRWATRREQRINQARYKGGRIDRTCKRCGAVFTIKRFNTMLLCPPHMREYRREWRAKQKLKLSNP